MNKDLQKVLKLYKTLVTNEVGSALQVRKNLVPISLVQVSDVQPSCLP